MDSEKPELLVQPQYQAGFFHKITQIIRRWGGSGVYLSANWKEQVCLSSIAPAADPGEFRHAVGRVIAKTALTPAVHEAVLLSC